jgi:5-methyltetrahydrofolate--homocysteine methyltransferase
VFLARANGKRDAEMANNLTTVVKSSKKEVRINRDLGVAVIGERINPTGRKLLQVELREGKFDLVRKDAVAQVAAGASILDVNAGLPGADEPALMVQLIEEVRAVTDDFPICIDSSKTATLEAALKHYCKDGARPLVNSVSAETKRIKEVLPLIKEYGCSVIGLCSGDSGIPKNAEGRFQYAAKIIEEADKLGIPAEDIVIDPLVLTLGTEWRAGKMVLDAIRMIVERFGVNITMGASNISFGMPDRENLTAFFMAMSVEAGLSCPICNPMKKHEVIALRAADLVMGRDRSGMKWIKSFRALQTA